VNETLTDTLQGHVVDLLLQAVGRHPAPDFLHDDQAQDYDWDRPSLLTPAQLSLASGAAVQIATDATAAVAKMLEATVTISSGPVRELCDDPSDTQQDRCCLELLETTGQCGGMIVVDGSTARALMADILGGEKDDYPENAPALSGVERDVLAGVLTVFAQALGSVLEGRGLQPLQAAQTLTDASVPARWGDAGCCELTFNIATDATGPGLRVILPTAKVVALAGEAAVVTEPQDPAPLMREYVNRSSLRVEVVLGEMTVNVCDLVELQEGDVLMLPADPGAATARLTGGRPLLTGTSAVCDNHYAFRVSARCAGLTTPKKKKDLLATGINDD